MSALTLPRPDDWHVHLRDEDMLADLVPLTAQTFGRALVMPNLRPPITTVAAAERYRRAIRAAVPEGISFEPLMTLYLTPTTSPAEIERAAASTAVLAVKYYPAGATTHSEAGVSDWRALEPVLAAMQDCDVPLLVHGETTASDVDVFDREAVFLRETLAPIVARFGRLRVVLEHVTTRVGVEFVLAARTGVAATVTPQHLLLNRNAMFAGGLRPHHYCLPVLKRESDRTAIVGAVTSGSPKFFLGTDSAPHPRTAKESDCGCAGVFNATVALPVYAQIFAEAGALSRLSGFASEFGAAFYRQAAAKETITLERRAWRVPARYRCGAGEVVPLGAGEDLAWRVEGRGRPPGAI
jgi:dihydroorotase